MNTFSYRPVYIVFKTMNDIYEDLKVTEIKTVIHASKR